MTPAEQAAARDALQNSVREFEAIEDAAQQLAASETGRTALVHLQSWFATGGLALDGRNQAAVLFLLNSAWGKYAGTTRDVIDAAVEKFN